MAHSVDLPLRGGTCLTDEERREGDGRRRRDESNEDRRVTHKRGREGEEE